MILITIYFIFLASTAAALPPDIRLPLLQDFLKAEQVNVAFEGASKVPRSINEHDSVANKESAIKEVEQLIQSNPSLPRLTRGEILEILDNITKQDELNVLSSYRDPKALMVVKAYTPLGSGEVNFDELYTKPPVTSIVEEDLLEPAAEAVVSTTTENVPMFRKKPTKAVENKNVRKKPSRGNVQLKTTTSTTTTTETTEKSTTLPQKRRRRPMRTTTTTMPSTYRPRRRQPPRKEIKYPNHKYPEESSTKRPTYPPEGIRIVPAPSMVVQSPSEINSELEDLLPQEGEHQEHFMPMPDNKQNSISPSIELEIPEHLKQVVADLNLAAIKNPESVSVSPKTEGNEAEKLKNILASIGANLPTTESPNANAVAESLSPDMQELLKSFGLLPDPNQQDRKNEIVQEFSPEKAETNPESFVGFKPLPEDGGSRRDMEELLTRFGLLDQNKRKGKVLKTGKQLSSTDLKKDVKLEQISLDAVPDDLKSVLHDMGFEPTRVERKIRQQPAAKHIFKPDDYVSEKEIKKLGRLMEIMKKLEKKNGNITEEDLKQINKEDLKDLIASLQEEQQFLSDQQAPNPIEHELSLEKKAVKRQEATTTELIETVTPESVPEETKTPSIKDLEDSFGGSSETVTEALPEATTPRRSGFYYLLDWNSFLDIDDQKGKRVNLRLQPKVGDPKNFYSVTVP